MKYKKRIVAFIDILGFKNSVYKSNEDCKVFTQILETLQELKTFFNQKPKLDTQITLVSDCLIISRRENAKGAFGDMLTDCAFAIHILINHGFLCRGAIKVGNMYHKNNILFGDAYIKAYDAEEKEKLPIVKFDEELFEIVEKYPRIANEFNPNWEINELKENCKELMTGVFYLDYFSDYNNVVGPGEGGASIHYMTLRDIIFKGLNKFKGTDIFEKYRWAADRFNEVAESYGLDKI